MIPAKMIDGATDLADLFRLMGAFDTDALDVAADYMHAEGLSGPLLRGMRDRATDPQAAAALDRFMARLSPPPSGED